jgi:hypothetical protein
MKSNLPVYKQKFWLIGISSSAIGGIFNILSTAYGDVVILASSGALTLMFNGIFSYLLLNESFSLRYDTVSTLLILTS